MGSFVGRMSRAAWEALTQRPGAPPVKRRSAPTGRGKRWFAFPFAGGRTIEVEAATRSEARAMVKKRLGVDRLERAHGLRRAKRQASGA